MRDPDGNRSSIGPTGAGTLRAADKRLTNAEGSLVASASAIVGDSFSPRQRPPALASDETPRMKARTSIRIAEPDVDGQPGLARPSGVHADDEARTILKPDATAFADVQARPDLTEIEVIGPHPSRVDESTEHDRRRSPEQAAERERAPTDFI